MTVQSSEPDVDPDASIISETMDAVHIEEDTPAQTDTNDAGPSSHTSSWDLMAGNPLELSRSLPNQWGPYNTYLAEF